MSNTCLRPISSIWSITSRDPGIGTCQTLESGEDEPHDEQCADLHVSEQLAVLVVAAHRRLVPLVALAIGRHVLAVLFVMVLLLLLLLHHRRIVAILDRRVRLEL
uniref:Uncharacterized protein n=1 Tax=Anopheles farauti TaxID=69004 RepID=A0A182QFC3_9DIPT